MFRKKSLVLIFTTVNTINPVDDIYRPFAVCFNLPVPLLLLHYHPSIFVLCFKKSSSSIFIQKRVKTISLNLNFKTVFYCTTNNLHLSSLGLLYVVFKREDAICVNFDCFFTKHIIIQQTFPSSMVSLDTIQSTLVS